jgi:hypothetical protein
MILRWVAPFGAAVLVTVSAFISLPVLVVAVVLVAAWLAVTVINRRRESWECEPVVDVGAFQTTLRELDIACWKFDHLTPEDRQGPRGRERLAEIKNLRGLLDAQYRGEEVPMPLLEPITVCPSCEERGAHLAELDAAGTGWRRICWGCGHRWVQGS